jgi:hypothetical protein
LRASETHQLPISVALSRERHSSRTEAVLTMVSPTLDLFHTDLLERKGQ